MPIYKVNGEKDGKQKYLVRINYISDSGHPKQLTRIAYGSGVAKDLERQLSTEIKAKSETPTRRMTIQELFDEYIEVKACELRKVSTERIRQSYKTHVAPTFKNYRIDRVTVKSIQDWKMYMEKQGYAFNTKQKAFIWFNAIMRYAVKMEYLQKSPLAIVGNFKNTLRIKPEMSIYTPEEFKTFIAMVRESAEEKEQLQNNLAEWDYYVFFNIAFYTGLRKGEIYALKWSDISGPYLKVARSVTQRLKGGDVENAPKNKSSIRTLQIPLPLLEVLRIQKERQAILHNFTDNFRVCGNVRDTSLQRRNEIYSAKAGLKAIRIHDFRHSHASVLANNNINIQEIARRMGHSQVEITWNTYCHLYPREEEKAVEVLNGFS